MTKEKRTTTRSAEPSPPRAGPTDERNGICDIATSAGTYAHGIPEHDYYCAKIRELEAELVEHRKELHAAIGKLDYAKDTIETLYNWKARAETAEARVAELERLSDKVAQAIMLHDPIGEAREREASS